MTSQLLETIVDSNSFIFMSLSPMNLCSLVRVADRELLREQLLQSTEGEVS